MSDEMPKVRITVLKRTFNAYLVQEYLDADEGYGVCEQFRDGQEFVTERPWHKPEGFCAWAWADIHKYILLVMGGGDFTPWVKGKGTAIACCTDGYRPVVFKIERTE